MICNLSLRKKGGTSPLTSLGLAKKNKIPAKNDNPPNIKNNTVNEFCFGWVKINKNLIIKYR